MENLIDIVERVIAQKPINDAINYVVDELIYRSYAFNRQRSPEISAERWAKVFGASSQAMEQRYRIEYLTESEPEMERDRR